MTSQRCEACRQHVPVGRWCNWCGAWLAAGPGTATAGRRRGWPAVAAGLGAVALAALGVATVGGGAPNVPDDSGVVVDDRAARPVPAASLDRTAPRTDVVCSDLRVRSVPSHELSTTEAGELVELAHGPCVVMGPEGTTDP